jgi:DNA polymerase-3 subunit alpha (Gram-positive type)
LVRLSGLSHGTDVWAGNAQVLIKEGIATLKEVIPTRDEIMVYLINHGVPDFDSFTIMEKVRKGKGLTPEHEALMREHDVPDWYIDSCKKIKYMFPKGHAVAYVTNTFRIGYFKIHFPYAFYAATFSVKIEDFDYMVQCFGVEKVLEKMKEINAKGNDATAKDKGTMTVCELTREMYVRGFKFVPIDIYKSETKKFKIAKDEDGNEIGLLPPLCAIQGFGETAAQSLVDARKNGVFHTLEEMSARTGIGKKTIDSLKECGILEGIPDTNQLTLFM